MLIVLVDRGQEHDRDALGLLAGADQLGGLIAVHAGHVDVEQDDREFALEEMAQRLLPGIGEHDLGDILDHRGHREQVARIVVHHQHARLGRGRGAGRTGDRRVRHRPQVAAPCRTGAAACCGFSRARAIQTRSKASIRSISTGLAM